MGYGAPAGSLTKPQNENWQVRIAIDQEALHINNPDNKVKAITDILGSMSRKYPFIFHVWSFEHDNDKAGYRITHGKEVLIHLADSADALTTAQYKIMLLEIWSQLAAAGVPLQFANSPGDKKIPGPHGLQTPFSVITHRIVHPIQQVAFTEREIKHHLIPYDLKAIDASIKQAFAVRTREGNVTKSEIVAHKKYIDDYTRYWLSQHTGSEAVLKKWRELSDLCEGLAEPMASKMHQLLGTMLDELFFHEPADLTKTPHLVVLNHFIGFVTELKAGKVFTGDELTASFTRLDNDLKLLQPVSKTLLTAISAFIGAVIGTLLGFTIGGIISIPMGGFGAIPGAILGGVIGGTAGAGAILNGTLGFFTARQMHQQYQKDKEALLPAIRAVLA